MWRNKRDSDQFLVPTESNMLVKTSSNKNNNEKDSSYTSLNLITITKVTEINISIFAKSVDIEEMYASN